MNVLGGSLIFEVPGSLFRARNRYKMAPDCSLVACWLLEASSMALEALLEPSQAKKNVLLNGSRPAQHECHDRFQAPGGGAPAPEVAGQDLGGSLIPFQEGKPGKTISE